MRRQDEIRLLFPSQDQESQKLLLSELDAYALAFDSEEVYDLLRAGLSSQVQRVRHQALVTMSYFLPRFYARRMKVTEEEAGLWTEYQNEKARPDPELLETLRVKREKLREKARDTLVPLAETLAWRFARLGDDVRPAAALALAYLGTDGVLDALSGVVQAQPTEAMTLWTWAFAGGAEREPERLTSHLDRYGVRNPDLLMAAAALPTTQLVSLAQKLDGRLDGAGTANIAYALSRQTGGHTLPVLEKLCKRTTGWGQVHVLRAAGASGHPQALDLIRHIHAHSQNGFVKQQAIRAAGGLFAQGSIDFCLEQAKSGEGGSVAQALETLVRLRCPRSELATVARPHIASTHLRTRVNAFLSVVDARSQTLPRGFLELLQAEQPLPRVEAAFCMGYWQHPACIDALASMSTSDAAPAVRQQSIKSLSKHPAVRSFPPLRDLVMTGPPGEAITAVRVLARGAQKNDEALSSILDALAKTSEPARHALLVRAASSLAAPEGDPRLEEQLARDLEADDAAVVAAALEGWKLIGGPREKKERTAAVRLIGHAEPAVHGAATVAGFLSGELSLLSRLESRLKSDEGAALVASCGTLLDLGLIASEVIGPGHALLGAALDRAGSSAAGLSVARYATLREMKPVASPLRAEGEFDMEESAGEAPAPRPTSKEMKEIKDAAGDKEAVLQELAAHYQKKPATAKGDVAQALEKDTYLVADKAAGKKMSEEPTSEQLMRGVRQAAAIVRMHPVLLVPPLVFLLVVGMTLFRTANPGGGGGGGAAGQPLAVALHVMHVTGRAIVPGETAPLVPGDVLRFGERFDLDGNAAVRLVTPIGDRIRVNGPAQVVIGKPGPMRQLELTVDEGTIDYVATAGGTLELHQGPAVVSSEGGSFVSKRISGKLHVEARVQPVWLKNGGTKEEVKVGQPKGE